MTIKSKVCLNCGEDVKRRGKRVIFCCDDCCTAYHARKRKGHRHAAKSIRRNARAGLPL